MIFLLFAPLTAVVVTHAILNRLVAKNAQAVAILAVIAGYGPFLALLTLWHGNFTRDAVFYLYFSLLYFGFAYTYFHFFNMSETSRRARLLGAIWGGQFHNLKDIETLYVDEDMVSVRLERLKSLKQVELVNGAYVSTGKVFPLVARILYSVGLILKRPWPAMQSYLKGSS